MCATNERNEKVESKITGLFPLFLTVLLAYMGQMILNPILAPLSREIGLKEWHIGATISLAAIILSLTSTRWGRVSLRWGISAYLAYWHACGNLGSKRIYYGGVARI